MPRVKVYIDTDVLTESRKRIHHIFDLFDTVVVMFSGGKDSLATLHLTREVMLERGITKPLDVVFRDEELVPDEVINFVNEYRQLDWIKMVWFTVPLDNDKFILGQNHTYVQWDPARKWVRPKPPWGESLAEGDDRVLGQTSMDSYTAARYRGKVAFLTGVRASESLIRLRSCVNKLNDNYINDVNDPHARNVKICKPLFDWEENDVFRYFYDRNIRYCPLYDLQMWSKQQLRVSTPLHAERAKVFDKLRTVTPDFYQRVIDVFPEMLVHERYYRELDRDVVRERYGQTYDGVKAWIDEHMDEEKQHAAAMVKYNFVMGLARKEPDVYPPDYLLGVFMRGTYTKKILPLSRADQERGRRKRAALP